MAMISDEHGRLPALLPRQGREVVFHGPELPGVPATTIQRTHSPRLWRESS
jgi:hypothetical protein